MKTPRPLNVISLLFLFLKAATIAFGCSYRNDHYCSTDNGITFWVYFDASGSDSTYEASLEFLWSQDEETINDSYGRGDEQMVDRTYRHDRSATDTFIVGFKLTFGENSGCNGKIFQELYEISYDSCEFYEYDEPYIYSSSTPAPTVPESITPEPITPAPITPVPIASIVVTPPPSERPTQSPIQRTPSPTEKPTPQPVIDIMAPTEGEGPTPPPVSVVVLPLCGDGKCEPPAEDYDSCPQDCVVPSTPTPSFIDTNDGSNGSASPTPAPSSADTNDSSNEKTMIPTNANDRPTELPSIPPTEEGLVLESAIIEESGNSDVPPSNLYFIIAGAAGGACGFAITLALGLFILRRKKSADARQTYAEKSEPDRTGLEIETRTTKSLTKSETLNQQGGKHLSIQQGESYFGTIQQTEIDDISTLGDPYMGEAVNAAPNADMTVGGESLVSQLQIYGIRPDPNGATSRMGDTTLGSKVILFGEDSTLEDIYENPVRDGENVFDYITVVAPAGMLGVVLNNPTGDLPVVYAIKETSPLRQMIRVGDYLISVDEVGCRGMTSSSVSAFLSSRSQNPTRTLVLARGSMNNTMSTAAAV